MEINVVRMYCIKLLILLTVYYILMYVMWGSFWKNLPQNLTDVHVFSSPGYEKVFGKFSACRYVHHASTGMVGLILFIFSIQEFIYHRSVPGECEHSTFRNMGP
jgi:hypothetical protein